jgi:hypothetical protein
MHLKKALGMSMFSASSDEKKEPSKFSLLAINKKKEETGNIFGIINAAIGH